MKKKRYYLFGYIYILTAFILCGAGPVLAVVAGHEFSRYQIIMDKKPFGEVTPSEGAPAQAALGDVFSKEFEMKAIIDDGSGIRVGLMDKKTNKNFFMTVGENHDGLQLISVDYENEEAVVKKGDETVLVKLHPDKAQTNVPSAMPSAVPALMSESPFQAAAPASSATRKPFFSDLKKRRASPFQPLGTNTLPFQGKLPDSFFKVSTGAFPQAKSPFGPFQVPQGGAAPGAPSSPFTPIAPAGGQVIAPNQNAPMDGKGATIDQLLQQPAGEEGQAQPAEIQLPAEGEIPAE